MTLEQELVLRLDVGHKTIIRDVQLWRETAEQTSPILSKNKLGELVGMINIAKLPFWLDKENPYQCYTTSETSFNYFKAKLMRQRHRNRGIIFKIVNTNTLQDDAEYWLFYKKLKTDVDAAFVIEARRLDLATKTNLDKRLQFGQQPNVPLPPVAGPSAATKSIESILEKNKRQRILKSNSLNKQVLLNDQHQQFVSMLSQCILSGLRLRAVPQAQYEKLYKMTYKASEFAFRNDLKQTDPIQFETIQDCVETLLKLFTKT